MKISNKFIIGIIIFFISLLFCQSKIFANYITNNELVDKKINNTTTYISGFNVNTNLANNTVDGAYTTGTISIQVVVKNNLGFTTTYNYKYSTN